MTSSLNLLLDDTVTQILNLALNESPGELGEVFELAPIVHDTIFADVHSKAQLSEFELKVLVICLAMELRTESMLLACAGALQTDGPFAAFLTPSLLRRWIGASESPDDVRAFQSSGRLLKWNLIELGDSANASLVEALLPVRITPGLLLYLRGDREPAPELSAVTSLIGPSGLLSDSQTTVASQGWEYLKTDLQERGLQLYGPHQGAVHTVAGYVLEQQPLPALQVNMAALVSTAPDPRKTIRSLARDIHLKGYSLLLDLTGDTPEGMDLAVFAGELLNLIQAPVVLTSNQPLNIQSSRALLPLEVRAPTPREQREQWALGLGVPEELPLLHQLGDQFHLSLDRIDALANEVRVSLPKNAGAERRLEAAWERARVANRRAMGSLADRIQAGATWADLVLPASDMAVLQQIAAYVKHRSAVYEGLGMARPGRGRAITALFSGPSGTGKTLSAEVLANDLSLDLYRIDLSSTVSKYIGETEKNLKRIFDAAEHGGCILLFDEADSVFGKRGEVRDSNDRYANIQVNYLLQRLESFNGLAVLTTNMESSMDVAFMRRIQFVLNFRVPQAPEREVLWRQAFPPALDTSELDFRRLAQADVSGGNIRSVALNAVFLSLARREPLSQTLVDEALSLEFRKLGRLVL
ncbi:ATP-binding protein [Deinococcus ficus]|uniref:ATP-binding protein n=1 Tax=Deinococcus ficus TaxID=317577 RepID=UPI00041CB502|nr:ATP-binding protein [Deinococcus ficus]